MLTDPASRRAAPLAPDDRRAAIVEAVLPLVGERGLDVTSKELAAAAGVAEGTLFRAFGDKTCLVGTVAVEGLRRAASAAETREALAAIDRSLPLEERLAQVLAIGRRQAADVTRWAAHLRTLHQRTAHATPSGEQVREFREQLARHHEERRAATAEGLLAVLEPDRHRLRVPPEVAVALVEAIVAGAHQSVEGLAPVPDPAVLADALVHGIAGGS
ncbi:TetR/AcrR family transcriptional regulator [Isoptericola variabilis]|uniref:Regulatory protein TetR n=1 Tax=Isoptericola variabilis (strain 225) TaxID=743718 RepID=F6FTN2_ISOV2|nr:TetR/AcrR family transcriptional regulator [Isoptericola variabilis]AEG44159.1 regulatory protein TetR [Isoptericola variabilis 225]TWH28528.1 TetR family transcriptional regulator [Isoptericola variabilis J7]